MTFASYAQLGARKSALGATKVTANFEDLEREAVMAEKLKTEVRKEVRRRARVRALLPVHSQTCV